MSMKNQFIPYELSLELKKLEFDEPCIAWYNQNGELLSDLIIGYESEDFFYVKDDMDKEGDAIAPTFSQVFRWFRENYIIFGTINVDQTMEPKFCYSITRYEPMQFLEHWDTVVYNSDLFYTYEEAEVECIKELIKVVKEINK
jgi:hypothetical protein